MTRFSITRILLGGTALNLELRLDLVQGVICKLKDGLSMIYPCDKSKFEIIEIFEKFYVQRLNVEYVECT